MLPSHTAFLLVMTGLDSIAWLPGVLEVEFLDRLRMATEAGEA